jgi:hypothetical protein
MNRLKDEDSPYLLQHAKNPVWWFPWSDEAFLKAQNEDKLIFLSIGYSTCHWCHVMEKESFENEAIANELNENFISIKVDREEMPHIDKYYQDVHYLLQRRAGGWPLSIVMLPNRKVVFAGTYLPAQSKNGMMGFLQLLQFFVEKKRNSADELAKSAISITQAIMRMQNFKDSPKEFDENVLKDFIKNIKESFDAIDKGVGSAPKFPHASTFSNLLELSSLMDDEDGFKIAKESLEAMALGGIYDQIEGGFYRYSVDKQWQIPHFEKMLYTNAELLVSLSKLYAKSPSSFLKDKICGIVEAMNERFLTKNLYMSASDADSLGEEGRYFVFKYDAAKKALLESGFDTQSADEILKYFNITPDGNFENKTSNPYCKNFFYPNRLDEAKKILKKLRSKTPFPFIDTKILTSWNALMVTGLFEAGKWVDKSYFNLGFKVLDSLINSLHVNGVLYHQMVLNSPLKVKGLLEDYAFLVEALITAYSFSAQNKYLLLAKELAFEAKESFYRNGSWYLSKDGFEAKAPLEDASYKSAAACMMYQLLRLALIEGNMGLKSEVQKMAYLASGAIIKYPHAYPEMMRTFSALLRNFIVLHVPLKQVSKAHSLTSQNPLVLIVASKESKTRACTFGSCLQEGELEDVLLDCHLS